MKVKFASIIIIAMMQANFLPAQIVVVKEHNDKALLWIEAEAGDINDPMMVYEREAASGGQFIEVKSGINSFKNPPKDGQAIYKFNVENTGIYKIWGRVDHCWIPQGSESKRFLQYQEDIEGMS